MDFDGTISKKDVGEEIFREFGNKTKVQKIIDELLNEAISSRECWIKLCENVGIIDRNKLDGFLNSLEIEPSFPGFVKYCSEQGNQIFILSDGFDYYINRILQQEGMDQLTVYSNELRISNEGYLIPIFPYYDEGCRALANCKRNHILENSGEEDFTIYIGDGFSDRDPIQYVDFIFAKNNLLKYCEKERISYFPFSNFNDVIVRLDVLASKKRLKKRYQAELKRREAFMIE